MQRPAVRGGLATLISLCSGAACAIGNPTPHAPVDALSWSSIFSVLFGLAIVIAMLLGAAWLLRRLQRVQGGAAGGAIRIVDQLPLGMKDRLLLVRIGDQQVLIGVSTGQMRALHAWRSEVVSADASPSAQADGEVAQQQAIVASPFMDQLKAVLAASARKPS